MTHTTEGAAAAVPDALAADRAGATVRAAADTVAFADCVLCGDPTEYPETVRGATLCPVCEWQEAQRLACSG